MSKHEFDAEIQEGRGGGAWVEIPFDVSQVFGTKGRVKVKASFDGHPCRGSLAPMGGGVHILGAAKAIRKAMGKSVGDRVRVVLERDTEPRTVTVPEALGAALEANPKAKEFFETLAYTHQRKHAQWIAGAKKEATRQRRLQKAIEKLSQGEKL